MFNRGERIMARDRMRAKAARVYPKHNPGKYADNLAKCSCWMCGNPRHLNYKRDERLTVAERRWLQEKA